METLEARSRTNDRSVFLSVQFLFLSLFFVADFSCVIYILEKYWGRLPDVTHAWLIVALVGLIMLWAAPALDRRAMRKISSDTESSDPDRKLDNLVRKAAVSSAGNLGFALFVSWILLLQVLIILGAIFPR